MSALIISPLIGPALQINRWIRNGRPVDAHLQNALANLANQTARWRTKQIFSWHGAMGSTTSGTDALIQSSGAGERERWRFAFHSGPYTKEVRVTFLSCIQDGTLLSGGSGDPYSRLRILTTGGSTVGDGTFHYGGGPNSVDTPNNFATGEAIIPVSADTDYTAVISDFDGARIVSAVVYERSLDPDTSNGYASTGYAAGVNIYDTDRSDITTIAANMWKRGGAHLLNWSADNQASPSTISLTTDTNIVDGTSTSVSSSSPGYILDLTSCNRLSQTTVPCVLKAYGKYVITPPVSGGVVKIKASDGSTVGTVTGFTSTASWQSAVVNMPTGVDRYDLTFAAGSGTATFSLYAVSLYQLE